MTRREVTISTRWFKTYYYITLGGFGALVLVYTSHAFVSFGWLGLAVGPLYIFLLLRYWYPSFRRMVLSFRSISYDAHYLYVKEPDSDILVPLEHIREVELISLDGVYRFHLKEPLYFGEYIHCKTSMWYPFNFPKVDKELDKIRWLIQKRKKEVWAAGETSQNQLSSYNV